MKAKNTAVKAAASAAVTAAAILLFIAADAVINAATDDVPSGHTSCVIRNDPNGGQDFTNYHEYYYPDPSRFVNNGDYTVVGEKEIAKLKPYFESFREWMRIEDRLGEYGFDESCVSAGDLYRLKEDGCGSFKLLYFDIESNTLYRLHEKN